MNPYLRIDWKPFKVYLPVIDEWLRANIGPNYAGNSADDDAFYVWFHEQPTFEEIQLIKEAAETLVTEHGAKEDFDLADMWGRAIAAAKLQVIYKDWNSMTVAERKVALSDDLSEDDKNALVDIYGTDADRARKIEIYAD